MAPKNFLVEIGTEELPAKSLYAVAQCLIKEFSKLLNEAQLAYDGIKWYATPRRLALKIIKLSDKQPDTTVQKRGPALQQAFDSMHAPTIAAKKWARSCGITLDQAQIMHNDQGTWLVHYSKNYGKNTSDILLSLTKQAFKKISNINLMYWGDKKKPFIRPVHTAILLFGDLLIPGDIFGVPITRTLRGHRFMGDTELTINHCDDYPCLLKQRGYVVACYEERKIRICNDINQLANKLGGQADLDEDLLKEITSLVEWPVVLHGTFDSKFLALPSELLAHTMKKEQKYVPVYLANGQLTTYFIFVSNIDSSDPQVIIQGNQKVIHPRLSDAQFFYDNDRQIPLLNHLNSLQSILFQQKLGSLYDKVERIKSLAETIASIVGIDCAQVKRASDLSKCDLATQMVFEFPELQGIMGMYYANAQKENLEVAQAIREHYLPRFSTDKLPTSVLSCTIAIADKLDTLVGIIGIGQLPTGDKDPFALRRNALGILRIIISLKKSVELQPIIQQAASLYTNKLSNDNVILDTINFFWNRLRAWYLEKSIQAKIVQAVFNCCSLEPYDIDTRINALNNFYSLPISNALMIANKRIAHLLHKNHEILPKVINHHLLQDKAEKQLVNQFLQLKSDILPLLCDKNYTSILDKLITLIDPMEFFFSEVMVMTKDDALRLNRLRLLEELRQLFLQVADMTQLN